MCPMSQETETVSTHKSTLFIWNKCYSLHSYSFCKKKKRCTDSYYSLWESELFLVQKVLPQTFQLTLTNNKLLTVWSMHWCYGGMLLEIRILKMGLDGNQCQPKTACFRSFLSLTQQLREEHQVDNPGAAALQKQAYSWTWEDLFCRGKKSRMGTIDKNLLQIFPANCHVPPGKSTYLFSKKFGQRFQILGRRRWCFVKDSLWSLSESFCSQDSHTLPHFCLWTDFLQTSQKRLC